MRKGLIIFSTQFIPSVLVFAVTFSTQTAALQPGTATNRPMRQQKHMVLTVGQDRGDLRGSDDKIIQAGIEYLDALGGGTLFLLPGVYEMRNSVYLSPNIKLRGSGDKTVLEKAPGAATRVVRDADWYEYGVRLESVEGFSPGEGIMLRSSTGDGEWEFDVLQATITAIEGDIVYLDRMTENNFWVEDEAVAGTIFPILTGDNIDDVVVEDIVLDGNRDNNEHINGNFAGGVYIQSCNRWRFKNVTSRNYNGDGFSFQVCDDIEFENCKAINNTDLGFHPGSGSQRPVFRNCESRGNSLGLFFCWAVADGVAENCIFSENKRFGISIGHRDTDNVIRNCTIERNGEVGILFRREDEEFRCGNRNRIENCIIRENGGGRTGIGIDIKGKTEDITITNTRFENTTEKTQKIGIRIGADAERINIENNTFENCPVNIEHLKRKADR